MARHGSLGELIAPFGKVPRDCGGRGNCALLSVIADSYICGHILRLRAVELMREDPETFRPMFGCYVSDIFWEGYLRKMETDCESVDSHPMLEAIARASEQHVLLIPSVGSNFKYGVEDRPLVTIALEVAEQHYVRVVSEMPWSYVGDAAAEIGASLQSEHESAFQEMMKVL